MPDTAGKRRVFRALHEGGCFVIPNPFDIGSARYLQSRGFKALATTSSGAGWSLGHADGDVPLDTMLEHIAAIVRAADVPVNADFMDGYGATPDDVAANVARCVATGVAGLSIEDATGDPANPLYAFDHAVARVAAARAAIDSSGADVLLTARAECYLTGHDAPLAEAIRRLIAFAEAGADCLYAPGPTTRADIAAIVQAVAPKPVNVLARNLDGLTVADLAGLGVRRISVGGLLARMAWTGVIAATDDLAEGRFDAFAGAASGGPLNDLFARDAEEGGQA
ncbi:isocitrate lyase/PEP mutase family protein [Bauldia litoralis]|uniref:2-Methylisocitrate lyase, PEP mutase family n=1 Tax=Bauldia litoralis TaxID=665467 RepID=A0A1G6AIJ3_9HYPH|nr:isocitrate lyase/phosphoenolpyruvate mutase family protein [Bauldia litoralis]SDB08232.1 2-Methylisocitrate lyase, PEP mutase family [Bauldia litoralis]